MRRDFVQWAEAAAAADPKLIFLTGDLGFDALEGLQRQLGPRFINAGVAEQNMISVAAGLAHQGLHPFCYSIAPFAVFRGYEQIRLDVALHGMNVKIVGNGGGYGYGIMGASHHALEDIAVLSVLPGFRCLVPLCNSDVAGAGNALGAEEGPAYLRLGFGQWPQDRGPLGRFQPVRRIVRANGQPRLTVAGLGPALLNVLPRTPEGGAIDVFAVSELPLRGGPGEIEASVRQSGRLLVVEEHAARGGLAEHLSAALAQAGATFRLVHRHAAGYPGGLYGSQAYHQQASGLDPASLRTAIDELLRA